MKTIFKYPVGIADTFSLDLPADAEILTVQMQGSMPYLWALLEPGSPKIKRHFAGVFTGRFVEGAIRKYVGTYQISQLVVHIFEMEP